MPNTQTDREPPAAHNLAAWILLVMAVVTVYAPVANSTFGYGDDFSMFFDGPSVVEDYLSAGRPVLVVAHFAVHRQIREVRQLRLIRAVAIAGAVLLASVYFYLARHWFSSPITCVCFSTAMVMLPSVQEYVAAAHCWVSTSTAAVGSAAALVAHWAFSNAPSRRLKWGALISAFSLMQLALLTYQPAAMWFWPVALFFVLDSRFLKVPDYRRATLKTMLAGLVFVALGFVAMKGFLFFLQTTPQDRGQLMTDPVSKIYWFARMQMTQALNLWQIYSGRKYLTLGTAAFTALLITAGYAAELRRLVRGRETAPTVVLQLASAIVAVSASHCHWLVIVNMTQSYRVAGALCASVFIAAAWSANRLIICLVRAESQRRFTVVLFVTVAILSMLKCQGNLRHYFIEPYGIAYRYVVFSLRSELTPDSTHVHMIRQHRNDGLITEELTQPFGWPFSMWRVDGVIEAALRESGVPHHIQEITVGEGSAPIPESPETVIVDMRELARFRTRD